MLPIATAHSRVLQLIYHGILTFQEAFSIDSKYSIFYNTEYIIPYTENRYSVSNDRMEMKKSKHYHTHIHANTTTTNPSSSSSSSSPSSPLYNQTNNYHHRNNSSPHISTYRQQINQSLSSKNNHNSSINSCSNLLVLRNKIKSINIIYQKYVEELKSVNVIDMIQFRKDHGHAITIPTFYKIHRELCSMYGGEYDDSSSSNNATGSSDLQRNHVSYDSYDNDLELLHSKIKIWWMINRSIFINDQSDNIHNTYLSLSF